MAIMKANETVDYNFEIVAFSEPKMF